MRKLEIIREIRNKTGVSKSKIDKVLDAFVEIIQTHPKVSYLKLGTFTHYQTKPRAAKNPKTGQMMEIPTRTRLLFRPSYTCRCLINSPNKQSEA